MPQAPGKPLKLCEACWGSLGIAATVGSQAMLTALVRKYFGQITAGCGSAACTSPRCSTATPAGQPSGNAAAAVAVSLAQKTLAGTAALCLGDTQRGFADSVTQLKEIGGWESGWCSLALTTESGNKDAAVAWLFSKLS